MAIRKTKPTSPGRRFATYQVREQITATEPERKLTEGLNKTGGRNVNGRITSRHRGGGAKRRYRRIDFKRIKDGIPAKVATIEYDPNRSSYIALLHYADGFKSYILAPSQINVGDIVQSGPGSDIRPGNCLALGEMPVGTIVHNVEMKAGQGGKLGRVPRHDRDDLQLRTPERQYRQGRTQPAQGQASAVARHRNEPGRPPARRWRGPQDSGWTPGDPLGQADSRLPDP